MPKRKRSNGRSAVATMEEPKEDLSSLKKIFDEASRRDEGSSGLHWLDVECPFCGEEFEVRVDPSEEGQEMIQDCQVCCKPVQMSVEMEDGEVSVLAYRE